MARKEDILALIRNDLSVRDLYGRLSKRSYDRFGFLDGYPKQNHSLYEFLAELYRDMDILLGPDGPFPIAVLGLEEPAKAYPNKILGNLISRSPKKYLLLWATLIQACLVSFVLILLPLFTLRRVRVSTCFKFQAGFYFLALGLAFLFIEIVFIQKFILFLNHPIYATAIVLGSFLFFAGLGSGYSKPFSKLCKKEGYSAIFVSILGITFYTIAFMLLSPFLFQSLLSLAPLVKGTLSIILIAPLAFCMGMPFPLGLSKVALSVPGIIPWAWGINGCASVLSAILATILTIHLGFNMVLGLAVILYLLAAAALQKD